MAGSGLRPEMDFVSTVASGKQKCDGYRSKLTGKFGGMKLRGYLCIFCVNYELTRKV